MKLGPCFLRSHIPYPTAGLLPYPWTYAAKYKYELLRTFYYRETYYRAILLIINYCEFCCHGDIIAANETLFAPATPPL